MNKISKKIVALATMAAFVLTLVPAAAFAAPGEAPSANASRIVIDGSQNVEGITAGETVDVDFVVNAVGTGSDNGTDQPLTGVKVWATDANGDFTDNVEFIKSDFLTTCTNPDFYKFQYTSGTNNGQDVQITNDSSFQVKFNRGGTYRIYAGVGNIEANPANDFEDCLGAGFQKMSGYITVKVDDPATETANLYLEGQYKTATATLNDDNMMGDFDLRDYDHFIANGGDTYTVTGTATLEDGKTPASGKTVTIESGDPGNLQFNKEGSVTTSTDNQGKFKFTFTMNDNRNVPVYITIDGKEYTVNILKDDTAAYDIDTIKDGGYVIAGNDGANFDAAYDEKTKTLSLADAVQFSITDQAGNAISNEAFKSEPAADGSSEFHPDMMNIPVKPEKSTLESWNLVLVKDGENYTLEYRGQREDAKTDLLPGKYEVVVSLASGDYARATFTVAKFGNVKDLVLDMTADDLSTNRSYSITDEVTLGQRVIVEAKYVDENGLKIPANKVNFGANGKAVVDEDTAVDNNNTLIFYTKLDVASNESLLGSLIDVWAFDEKEDVQAYAQLTVVDSYNAFNLEFDPTTGATNKENIVNVKVVKEDGTVANVNGDLYVYAEDPSNEDAKVTVKKLNNGEVKNGKGQISIYGTEDTNVNIAIAVKDDSNTGMYVGNLEYTIGSGDILAHHNVVMTIGSSQYVVDKQLFTMDAAPYVDSNWRTMVPIRALAEAFDATVTYDNDDRTVTIEYNEQTIVMTVDESTYTINGEEAEMDTEAVIKGDRTYVPVRFAAEAMGFKVTALYDENSSTASVVFQS